MVKKLVLKIIWIWIREFFTILMKVQKYEQDHHFIITFLALSSYSLYYKIQKINLKCKEIIQNFKNDLCSHSLSPHIR